MFRYTVRTLLKSPGFAAATILVLALGIGANTAIFSVLNTVLLQPLPYPRADRIVTLAETNKGKGPVQVSGLDFKDWRSRATAFQSMAAYEWEPVNFNGGKEPEQVIAAGVSRGFFSVMGTGPVLGRTFAPDEERIGGTPVAVIGERLWKRQFAGDPGVIGRTVKILQKAYTVVGVMPASFDFPKQAEAWVSLELEADVSARSAHNYRVIGRLKSGVPVEQARAQMTAIAKQLEAQYPDSNHDMGASVVPLWDQNTRQIRPTLYLLAGAVWFVLLIACANAANLLLSRGLARQKEVAIRAALGASRGRLIRSFLMEAALLSSVAGALGLLLSWWGADFLGRMVPPDLFPAGAMALDYRVLAFVVLASAFTALVFGLVPALHTSRADLNDALKVASSRTSTSRSGQRTRGALIVVEVAVSFVLLAGAGLTLKSLLRLQSVNPGFDGHGVMVAELSFPHQEDFNPFAEPERALMEGNKSVRAYDQLLERVRRIPGVLVAGTASSIPLTGFKPNGGFLIEGRPAPKPGYEPYMDYRLVSEDYFRTLQIPLKAGRTIETADRANPNVAIINETAAREFFPGGERAALGQRIRFFGFGGLKPQWLTVIGVVGDIHDASLSAVPEPAAYAPYFQNPWVAAYMSLVVRTQPGAGSIEEQVRAAAHAVNPETPVKFTSMDAIEAASIATSRLRSTLISLFAGFALILALAGIYSVISYTAAQRVQEIGIRMALGAKRRDVLALLIRQGLIWTALGAGIGLAGSLAMGRVLRGFLYGISPADPSVLSLLTVALLGMALLASFIPAWRASRLDPLIALRDE